MSMLSACVERMDAGILVTPSAKETAHGAPSTDSFLARLSAVAKIRVQIPRGRALRRCSFVLAEVGILIVFVILISTAFSVQAQREQQQQGQPHEQLRAWKMRRVNAQWEPILVREYVDSDCVRDSVLLLEPQHSSSFFIKRFEGGLGEQRNFCTMMAQQEFGLPDLAKTQFDLVLQHAPKFLQSLPAQLVPGEISVGGKDTHHPVMDDRRDGDLSKSFRFFVPHEGRNQYSGITFNDAFSQHEFKKYSMIEVVLRWTPEMLDRLREDYYRYEGLPGNIHRFFFGAGRFLDNKSENSNDNGQLFVTQRTSHQFFWWDANREMMNQNLIFTLPNVPYLKKFDREVFDGVKPLSKDNGGFRLICWWIHSDQILDDDVRSLARQAANEHSAIIQNYEMRGQKLLRENEKLQEFAFVVGRRWLSGAPMAWLDSERVENPKTKTPSAKARYREQRSFCDTMSNSAKAYASPLDLDTVEDGVRLENLQQNLLRMLKEEYGVSDDDGDEVILYFHFPYVMETVTLHLHVKVNQAMHPIETQRSLFVKDIIHYLRAGRTVKDLVMDHRKVMLLPPASWGFDEDHFFGHVISALQPTYGTD